LLLFSLLYQSGTLFVGIVFYPKNPHYINA
jgi:hypothetical protein